MSGVRQRFVGLCLPPLGFAPLDGALTLAGQSAEYWGGAYSQVDESSPTFHHQTCNGLFLLAAVALGLGIRWGWQAGPSEQYRLPLSAKWRCGVIAVLFAVAVCLFLWPRSA